jgi:hypothetical protein
MASHKLLFPVPLVDPSGRFVLFLSTATGLTTNVVAGDFHLYLRDLLAGSTSLLDADTNGFGFPKNFMNPARLTPDGRFLAFDCSDEYPATNIYNQPPAYADRSLVPGDNNGAFDVFLRDITNGVAVTPSVSGNFVQGVWTGVVVISQTASNLVLQANDGLGHFGLANPINVINLPSLGMFYSGNIALLMWPVGYSGFVLETSASLSPATWVSIPYAPFQIGDQCLLPLEMTVTNGFYRLRFSGP